MDLDSYLLMLTFINSDDKKWMKLGLVESILASAFRKDGTHCYSTALADECSTRSVNTVRLLEITCLCSPIILFVLQASRA